MTASVRLDIVLPNESPGMEPDTLVALARDAERLGYSTAWLPDHILPPEPYGDTFGGVYEPLITVAHLAARTSRIRYGTSVLVVPLRNPFVLAKQVGTLARVTVDRFVLGVGAGWSRAEFDNVGADFDDRGRRTDQALDLLRHLHGADGEDPATGFDARIGYRTGVFAPRPQRPVPIMVGGVSNAALARAARVGDEWQGVGLDANDFAERLAHLRSLSDRPIVAGTRIVAATDADVHGAAQMADALAQRGAQAVAVAFGRPPGTADRMAAFAEAVRGVA